ncbi:MAG: carbohydrate ABC transporter permease [Clostridiales bacterium]|nr:carbohydrate ABC transporter permease [Clostridiales bacterium]
MKKKFTYREKTPIIFRRSGKAKIFYGFIFIIFSVYSLSLLAPLLMIFFSSFKDPLTYNNELFAGTIYNLPEKWVFSNYTRAFTLMKVPTSTHDADLLEMTWNTLWSSVGPAALATISVLATGYVCARYENFATKFLRSFALVLMILPVFGAQAASLKLFMKLGLYNNPLGMFVTAFAGFGMNFFIVMGFFKGISWEYAEAVFIDGGGHFTVFFKVMLPQATPMALVFFFSDFLMHYSSYESMLLYMPDYITIATGLYYEQMLLPRLGETPVFFAALFMSAIPIAIYYAIFGKRLMTSMNIGGLKG